MLECGAVRYQRQSRYLDSVICLPAACLPRTMAVIFDSCLAPGCVWEKLYYVARQ